MTLRTFIAIPTPTALQEAARQVQRQCDEQTLPWRWAQPGNLHLTLKFLGNVTPDTLDTIVQAMVRAVSGYAPFSLTVRGLGCFPNPSRPRVLWMGIEDAQNQLESLQRRLDTALHEIGFAPEARPFHPHLTLARSQQKMERHKLQALLHAYQHHVFGELPVRQLHLFQSQLQRGGAVYTILQSVSLPG